MKSPGLLNISDLIGKAANPAIQFTVDTKNPTVFGDPLFEKGMYSLTDYQRNISSFFSNSQDHNSDRDFCL